jgi:hypothetical protein
MDKQDVCPGYDDNKEAPFGCSVTKNTLVVMGVIHQWILLFQKGGSSEIKYRTEMRNNKYPWKRRLFDILIVFSTGQLRNRRLSCHTGTCDGGD